MPGVRQIKVGSEHSECSISRAECIGLQYTHRERQAAQLSQRDRAMLRVIAYFPKSLKVVRNDTVD